MSADAAMAALSMGGLVGLVLELNRRDKPRYRDGKQPVLNCRVHKRGGMWFFRIGRFGGSFYVSKQMPSA